MNCISDAPPILIEDPGAKMQTWASSDDFCLSVLQPFHPRNVHKAYSAFLSTRSELYANNRLNREQLSILDSLARASSPEAFKANMNSLYMMFIMDAFRPANFINLCLQLYACGVVLFPRNTVKGDKTIFSPKYTNQSIPIIDYNITGLSDFCRSAKLNSRSRAQNNQELISRWAGRVILTLGPFRPDLLITDPIATAVAKYAPVEQRKLWALKEAFYAINRSIAPDGHVSNLEKALRRPAPHGSANSSPHGGRAKARGTRSDRNFSWSTRADPTVEEWRQLLASWVASLRNRKRIVSNVTASNHFLDYLIGNREITRNPTEFLTAGYPFSRGIIAYLDERCGESAAAYLSKLFVFFEYVLNLNCSDSEGSEFYRLQGFINPINYENIPSTKPRPGQTHRLVVPTAWIRILQEIITRSDFRWPKETFCNTDWIRSVDLNAGLVTDLWCPVRAYFILAKLTIPLRTHQLRMLDSGEGEQEILDAATRNWLPNTLELARTKESQGVLRRVWDADRASWFTGIYVNTNKTADRNSNEVDDGYLIPWENEQFINIVLSLREWQVKNNRLVFPTVYSGIPDANDSSSDVIARTPDRYYLFRDPISDNRSAPVSAGRLRSFWLTLCAELEVELQRRGISNLDGSAIQIIDSWRGTGKDRIPSTAIFDLHSLRATGLTAFAKAGVPISILSKLVAGHASVLMTLYYTKFDFGYVSDYLNKAQHKMNETAQAEMTAFILAMSSSECSLRTAFNSLDGISAAKRTQPGLWQWMDHGICPNGRTRCHEGGEAIVDQKDRKYHGPVRGGAGNCALCRFFITGHQFLMGLVAKLNEVSFEAAERAKTWRFRTEEEQKLKAARIAAEDSGDISLGPTDAEILRCSSAVEEALRELDLTADTMHGYHNLIEQAKVIANFGRAHQSPENQGLVLITNAPEDEEISVKYSEVPEFEVVDEICRTARFYRSINWTMANLRRRDIFSKMLIRNGIEPIYMGLSDEMSKICLDSATDLLRLRTSRDKVNTLMIGGITLAEMGLLDETISLIEKQIGRQVLNAPFIEYSTLRKGSNEGAEQVSNRRPPSPLDPDSGAIALPKPDMA